MTTFEQVLEKIRVTHDRKNADYAEPGNWASNFEESAFNSNVTPAQAFEVLISTKQARIRQLTKPGRVPKNESLADSLLDRAVYSLLAYTYHIEHYNEPSTPNSNGKKKSSR